MGINTSVLYRYNVKIKRWIWIHADMKEEWKKKFVSFWNMLGINVEEFAFDEKITKERKKKYKKFNLMTINFYSMKLSYYWLPNFIKVYPYSEKLLYSKISGKSVGNTLHTHSHTFAIQL